MGISAIISTIGSFASAVGAAATGLTAGLGAGISGAIGAGVTGAITGAAASGGIAAVTGKSVPKALVRGAETGGLTGGAGSLIHSVTGLSAPVSSALAGGGAAALQHGNVALGALGGYAQGGGFSPAATAPGTASAAAPSPLGDSSAFANLAPEGIGGSSPDIVSATSALDGGISGGANGRVDAGQLGAGAAGGDSFSETKGISAGAIKQSPLAAFGEGATPMVTANYDVNADPLTGSFHAPEVASAPGSAFGTTASSFGAASPAATWSDGAPGHDLLSMAASHPLQTAELAALGYGVLQGNQPAAGSGILRKQAGEFAEQGALLEGYLASGTLPPGMQHGIDAATAASQAAIRANYAQHGMSGSSAEYQDLSAAKERAATAGAQIADRLYSQGVAETGLSTNIYDELMRIRMTQDQNFSAAVGRLSTAMAMMGQPLSMGA